MKPIDVKDNIYIDIGKESNDEGPKFKIGDIFKISKYKNTFVKGYAPNSSKEIFVIKKVKNALPWTDVNNDLNGEEHFMKKSCKKQIRKNLE